MPFSNSRARSFAAWAFPWLFVLMFPVLLWLSLWELIAYLSQDPSNTRSAGLVRWVSGIVLTVLSIAAVGIVARRATTGLQMANFMTGAFAANFFAMDPVTHFLITLPQYLGATAVGFGIAVGIWLWRRKGIQTSAL